MLFIEFMTAWRARLGSGAAASCLGTYPQPASHKLTTAAKHLVQRLPCAELHID